MQKNRKIFLFSLILATSLTACGGGNSSSKGGNSKTLITFYGWGSVAETTIFSTMIDEFKKIYPEYDVDYKTTSADNFITNLAGFRNNPRNMPDVFYMPDTSFVEWANDRNNIMLDLTEYINKSEVFTLDNVWSEGINAYRFDANTKKLGTGGIYGLPKDLGPNALTYNKDLVKSNGVTIVSDPTGQYGYNPETKTLNDKVPMTWAQFVRFCEDNTSGTLDKTDSIVGITHYPLESAYYSIGGNFLDETNKIVNISNDKFAESLQFVADLSNKFQVMTTAEGQNTQNGLARFSSGLAASTFMGAWECPDLWEVNFDWDILYSPIPNETGDLTSENAWKEGFRDGCSSQSYLGSVAFSVYKNSKVKEGAYKLAEFLSVHPTAQRINYELGQAVPNLKDMANGEFLTATLADKKELNRPLNREVYVHMMEHSKRRPQAYAYNDYWWNEMWESTSDETKLYRVWYPTSSKYGDHVNVWDWNSKSRLNNSFLDTLQASCQTKLDPYTSRYSW